MNVFHNTINKREVKQYASFVLLSTLKLEAITEKTKVETLIDILLGAAMRGSSIEQTCQQHEDAPCGKTIRTHLEQQIESIKDAEVRINRGLRKNIPKQLLRKPIKVAMDCVEIGYYGMPDGPNVLRTSKPKDGTSMFHTYCTAYVVEKGERYTLAMTYVMKDDSMFDVVRRLNKRLIQLGIKVELYLFDRGYYSVQVVRWLIKYNKPFIIPVRVFGKKAKGDKPATGMRRLKKSKVSFWERYTMHSQEYGEVTFDVAVCCDNFKGKKSRQGKGKRHGRRTLVYATYGVKDHSFAWIRDTYRLRFGIEASYRQVRSIKIKTTTTNTAMRFLYLGVSFILRNIWVWMHWNIFAQKQVGPGGRKIRLQDFSLDLLKSWIASVIDEIYRLKDQIWVHQPLPLEILNAS